MQKMSDVMYNQLAMNGQMTSNVGDVIARLLKRHAEHHRK